MKKIIARLVVVSLIAANLANVKPIFALEEDSNTGYFTEEFLNASDDTIVCYMEGFPITKRDINEKGIIKQTVMDEVENYRDNEISTFSTKSHTRTIPSGYNQAIVRTKLSVKGSGPAYGQTNTQYYFTHLNGAKFASGVEQKVWKSIVGTVTGFVKMIGSTATILFTADALYKSSVAGKIRSYTNNGKKVKITEAKSRYGTFYGVFSWTNRIIETHKTYSSGTVETITDLQYKK